MPEPRTILPLASGTGAGSADYWRDQLRWSAEQRAKRLPAWRKNVEAYLDKLPSTEGEDDLRVNIEYEKTEQKKYQLFYRLPEVKLRPSPRTTRESYALNPQTEAIDPNLPPQRDLKKAITVFREALRRTIGDKGANTKALMDEIVFDVLCPSGIAYVKLGYERSTSGTVPMQIGMEEQPIPGAVLGLGPSMQVPIYGPAPNIVGEQYYSSRISPARGLKPAEFMGSDYGKAPWLGHDFWMLPEVAQSKGWTVEGQDIKASDKASIADDDRIVKLEDVSRRTGQIHGRELFYYPYLIGQHDNPDKIRRVVFIGDSTKPVVHEDYKDQVFSPQGRWLAGFRTLPILVLTLRYVSDSSDPPSDCQITRRPSDQLAAFRTQRMKHRRKAVPRNWINVDAIQDEKIKARVIAGKHYDDIPVSGRGDNLSGEISKPSMPEENAVSEELVQNQIDRAWALGGNQAGVTEEGSPTATEIVSIAQATANRLGGEREKVVAFWLRVVEGLAALMQLYADREEYVEIAGEEGATIIEAWDKRTIAGEFLFEVVPDSSMPPDAAADRQLALNAYNLLANDPFVNRQELVRATVEAYGLDADKLVVTPEPTNEKPKFNVAINGKDLDPAAPQYPNVISLLHSAGIPEFASAAPKKPTGDDAITGPAEVVDREHTRMAQADETDRRGGGLLNTGATA